MFTRHFTRVHSAPLPLLGLTLLAAVLTSSPARAQTVFSAAHTIAAATTAVPVEETFNVASAGSYTITLTDLGAQLTPAAPLQSVKLAVTNGKNTLVGTVLVGAGTLTLTALPADTYVLHVVGMPGSTPGSGPIGIQVNGPGATQLAAFQATLALPAQPLPNGEGVLDDTVSVGTSGNYTITLTDLQLPQSLTTLTLLLIQPGSASPLAILPVPGTGALQATVSLTSGVTYDVFAVGAPAAAAGGGLYGAVLTDGSGSVAYGRAVPVGSVNHVGSAVLGAGSTTLTLTDLKYPAALSQLESVATLSGQAAGSPLTAAGLTSFTAVSGTYEVFGYAAAATSAPAAGSYAIQVTQGTTTALGAARAVLASGSTESAFSFDTTVASAGSYSLSLADFQFPVALSTLSLAAVQGGALLGTPLSAAGNDPVTAAAGPISILVFAQAASAGGLFGIELAPTSGGTAAYQTTQAVGTLFSVQQVQITATGTYAVTATDLAYPASFANYDTIVTQGTKQFGSIFGGGTFDFPATPGTYYLNFIAQPSGSDQAGTYALTVAPAPPAPVVTLSVDHPQITSGGMVDLTWSSQNATSCNGTPSSGGWGGTQATSGTVTSGALTSTTTFTLTCTGAGGSTPQSLSVTVTAPSGGGGGAIDGGVLALLCGLFCRRALRRL